MPHPEHERNREAWNDMVEIHYDHPSYLTKEFLSGDSTLRHIEKNAFGDVRGKTLLHLMCQFGLDSLSWVREGAVVTGVDISDNSITRARQLTATAGLEAEFVRSDVFDLPAVLDKTFDLVYQSYGTICWLSDIFKWARVAASMVRPGGKLLLIDDHPAFACSIDPPVSYFYKDALVDEHPTDYADRNYVIKGAHVEWIHPVSEIINAMIEAGLTIQRFEEYPYGYYTVEDDWIEREDRYCLPPGGESDIPLMFSILATKPIR